MRVFRRQRPAGLAGPKWVAATAICLCLPVLAVADAPDANVAGRGGEASEPFHEKRLPVRQLPARLSADWQPLRRAEYRALVKASTPPREGPPTTTITRADYFAVLTDDTLEAGRLAFRVKHLLPDPSLLSLDPLNLAVSHLEWRRGRATWGTVADGRMAVLVERRSGLLEGSWSLKGRRLRRRIDFRVKLTPATASQMILHVPAGWMLETSAGQVTGPGPTSTPGWARWRIDLGSISTFRLVVRRPVAVDNARPIVLVESDVTHMIRPDLRELRARFFLDVYGTATRAFTLRIPENLNVLSVTYGNEVKLQHRVGAARNGWRSLRIQFAEPLLGKSRSITVLALVEGKSVEDVLPQLRPVSGAFLSSTVHLQVTAPLKIQSLTMQGMRQATPVSETRAGETLSFSQWSPDARLRVVAARTRPIQQARVASFLDLTGEEWTAQTQIDWSVKNGATFSVECGLLPGWKIRQLQVDSLSGERQLRVQADWKLRSGRNGRRVVVVDLPDSLKAGEPISVKITASRPSQLRLRRVPFPVVRPLGCESVRHLLGVRHRSRPVLANRREQLWKPILQAEIPRFARGMAPTIAASAVAEPQSTFFESEIAVAPGFLSLNGGRPVVDAKAWAIVKAENGRLRQRVTISVTPVGEPIRQVFVYLPTTDRTTVWKQPGADGPSLTATRLPRRRHAEWSLPAGGQLWDVRFSKPTSRPVELLFERDSNFQIESEVDLAYVPGARTFRGIVELTPAENAPFTVNARGPQPVAVPQSKLDDRPGDPKSQKPRGTLWKYQFATDQMTLAAKPAGGNEDNVATASLRLESVLSNGTGHDAHTATYEIAPHLRPGRFLFRMPARATLVGVSLNGKPLRLDREDDAYLIRSLPPGRRHRIAILYRLPSDAVTLRTQRRCPIPEVSPTMTRLEWKLALPPRFELARAPAFGNLSRPLPAPSWTKRLFGPLGRGGNEPVFNPFRWTSWAFADEEPASDAETDREKHRGGFAPAGWTVYEITTPAFEELPAIDVWDRTAGRRIAWVVLLACLTIGLLVRRYRFRFRGKLGAVWFSACLVAAWVVAGIYAEIIGSGLIGAVIAMLVPRQLVRRSKTPPSAAPTISVGSTASYPGTPVSSSLIILLLSVLLTRSVTAYDTEPMPNGTKGAATSGEPERATESGVLTLDPKTVVVPVDQDGAERSIVYMHRDTVARMRAVAAWRSPSSAYLIRSADYKLGLDGKSSALVEARLHVDVYDASETISVALPFRRVVLSGSDACRVDGHVQPLRLGQNGAGYVVDLTRRNAANSSSGDAATTLAIRAPLMLFSPAFAYVNLRRPDPVTPYQITLRFRVKISGDDGAGKLKFRIPAVAASRLTFDARQPLKFAEIATALGRAKFDGAAGGSASVELGRTEVVEAAWSADARPVQPPAQVDASVFTLVDVHPSFLDYRFTIRCRPRTGSMDSVVLRLPRGMAVRQVRLADDENGVDSYYNVPENNRNSRLLVQLTEPRKKAFDLEVTTRLPLATRNARKVPAAIPVFELFPKQNSAGDPGFASVTAVADYLGLQTTPGFDLQPAEHDRAALSFVDVEEMRDIREWPEALKRPPFLYRVLDSTRLPFEMRPRLPARTVHQIENGRFHRGFLEWTMTAQVETKVAPAMLHQIDVDPKLRIDSISVVEDKAPRLVRWSKNGQRITLFLMNKTTSIQTVTLAARLPLPVAGSGRLPRIRFVDAETVAASVQLSRDADCLVDFKNLPFEKLAPPLEAPGDNGRHLHIGNLNLTEATTLPAFRIAAREQGRRVETLTLLKPGNSGRIRVELLLRGEGGFRSSGDIRLRLPAEFAGDFQVEPASAQIGIDRRADGSAVLVLRPPPETGRNRTVTISTTLADSLRRERLIPSVELLDASFGECYLATSLRLHDVNVVEPFANVALDQAPDWVSRVLASERGIDTGSLCRRPTLSWSIARRTASPLAGTFVALMETQIGPGNDKREFGRTTMLVIRPGRGAFTIRLPEETSPRAVLVDGKPVRWKAEGDGLLAVPISDSRPAKTIVLHWQRDTHHARWPVETRSRAFPRPATMLVRQSVVTCTRRRTTRIVPSAGAAGISRLQLLLVRLEGLLDACEAIEPSIDHRPAHWDAARQSYQAFQRARQSLNEDAPRGGALNLVRVQKAERRFRELQESIRGLPIPDEVAGSGRDGAEFPALGAPPVEEFGFYAVWPVDESDAEFSYWLIDLRVISWLVGGIVFCGLWPAVRRIVKLETGAWLSSWEPASWAALGVIWWLCLTPSFVGAILVLIGMSRAVLRRRRRVIHVGDSFQMTR